MDLVPVTVAMCCDMYYYGLNNALGIRFGAFIARFEAMSSSSRRDHFLLRLVLLSGMVFSGGEDMAISNSDEDESLNRYQQSPLSIKLGMNLVSSSSFDQLTFFLVDVLGDSGDS